MRGHGRARVLLTLGLAILATFGACNGGLVGEEEVRFQLTVHTSETQYTPPGLHYQVNGASIGTFWQKDYVSLRAACSQLGDSPLVVDCLTPNNDSCGRLEISQVCCWAPNILDTPVIKGEVYFTFRGDGTGYIREGICHGQDGTSTHGDRFDVDAGIDASVADAAL